MKSTMSTNTTLPNITPPRRVAWSEDVSDIFSLIQDGQAAGLDAILVTIVGIEGGSPRGVGAHMAVLSDGRYLGYVSGGCVEAAVAAEALIMLAEGASDTVIRFGAGSRYMDIKLPCGGAIDLHFCFNPDAKIITEAIARQTRRECFAFRFAPLQIAPAMDEPSAWHDGQFVRVYPPQTKLLLCGNGLEMTAIAKLARASGYAVEAIALDADLAGRLSALDARVTIPKSLGSDIAVTADAWTAIVFLFHDFDWEMKLIPAALATGAFYIGALGSPKTHQARLEGLRKLGVADVDLARIRGPVGLIPATRDAATLAISVLAEVTLHSRYRNCQT
jgi:xanthine dehydrogenase accessory factor